MVVFNDTAKAYWNYLVGRHVGVDITDEDTLRSVMEMNNVNGDFPLNAVDATSFAQSAADSALAAKQSAEAAAALVNTPSGAAIEAGAGSSTIIYVSTSGNNSSSGKTWGSAKLTISAALATLPASGGLVIVGPGTFVVDPNASTGTVSGAGIVLSKPNTTLRLSQNTIIKASASPFNSYAVVRVTAADCRIEGPGIIMGEIDIHTAAYGEWGHCIDINAGADRLVIEDVTCTKAMGDGINMIGAVKDVKVINATCDKNTRQGMSIIDAVRPKVIGGTYSNTGWYKEPDSGLGPCAGIDLEPNAGTKVIGAILEGVNFTGNHGPGLLGLSGGGCDATATNCHSYGDGISPTLGGKAGFYIGGSSLRLVGCTADGASVSRGPGFYVSTGATNARMAACTARNGYLATVGRGFFIEGTAWMVDCVSEDNATAGLHISQTATARVTNFRSKGDAKDAAAAQKFGVDCYSPTSVLTNIIVTNDASTLAYGIVLRPSAAGVQLINSDCVGTYATAKISDQTGGTFIFPKIGAAVVATLPAAATDAATTQALANSLRTTLISLGLAK